MRNALLLILVFNLTAGAQTLRDINYIYHYDPMEPFTFTIKAVRSTNGWTAYYNLTLRDTTYKTEQFMIQWDLRQSIDEKQGTSVDPNAITKTISKSKIEGTVSLGTTSTPQILTAKILNNFVKRAWIFYKTLEPNYPVNGYLTSSGKAVEQLYVKSNSPVVIAGEGESKIVSYYKDDFPAAVPAFSEGMGKVSRGMKVDSTFTVPTKQEVTFAEKGLYLVQQDTSAVDGFAFRVEDDYPRLAKIETPGRSANLYLYQTGIR